MVTVTFPETISFGIAAGTELINTVAFSSSEVITPVLASITITVQNAVPIAVGDGSVGFITDEDTIFTSANVPSNDNDPNDDSLTVLIFNTTGTLDLVASNGDGTFDYDPSGQFESLASGEETADTFTYTVSDGNGGTDTAAISIIITGVQDNFCIFLPLVVR